MVVIYLDAVAGETRAGRSCNANTTRDDELQHPTGVHDVLVEMDVPDRIYYCSQRGVSVLLFILAEHGIVRNYLP